MRNGGIVKVIIYKKNPSVSFADSSLYTREPSGLPLRYLYTIDALFRARYCSVQKAITIFAIYLEKIKNK